MEEVKTSNQKPDTSFNRRLSVAENWGEHDNGKVKLLKKIILKGTWERWNMTKGNMTKVGIWQRWEYDKGGNMTKDIKVVICFMSQSWNLELYKLIKSIWLNFI